MYALQTVHVEVVAGIHPNKEIRRVKGGEFVCSEEEKEVGILFVSREVVFFRQCCGRVNGWTT